LIRKKDVIGTHTHTHTHHRVQMRGREERALGLNDYMRQGGREGDGGRRGGGEEGDSEREPEEWAVVGLECTAKL